MKKKIISVIVTLIVIINLLSVQDMFVVSAAEVNDEMSKLFYGYNAASGKSLMANDALQGFPIIDEKSDYAKYILKRTGNTEQQSECFSSTSKIEVADFLSAEIGTSAYGKIGKIGAEIGSVFNLSKTAKNCCSVYYDLYTTSITRYNYIVQLNVSEIRQYLSKNFTEEINNIENEAEAKSFLEKYGTHLNTGYSFGGRLVVTNYKSTSDSSIDFSEATSLDTKMSLVISKVNAGVSGSIEEEYGTYENTSESKSTYKFISYGGEAISSLTIDDLFTYNASIADGNNAGFMYTRWINSINQDKDLTIIGIPNGAQCIPVWDLLENTAKNSAIRQYLIDAYIELCGGAYKDFTNTYADLKKTVNTDENGKTKFSFNGLFVKTENDYFYYVEADDFTAGGNHNEIHNGDTVYLDLSETTYNNFEFTVQGGEMIDKNNYIFKVNENSETFMVKCKYDGESEQILCQVPIEKCEFEGGTGKENYPYLITNASQFYKMSSNLTLKYLLLNDIDFNGKNLSIMGEFKGEFDGNYCTLSNFTIGDSNGEYSWGLFSSNSGTIKNLKIEKAGTSVYRTEFENGGDDYESDNYDKNSVSVKNAGIICGQNSGTIDNCYVENTYIRNIIKNSDKLMNNSEITMTAGAITGKNTGTISNCMVYNSNILSAFIYEDANKYGITIYTGEMVGYNNNGKIISCVADTGNDGSASSVIRNNYKNKKSGLAIAYTTAFAGYCDNKSSIENCYVFCNEDVVHSCIDYDFGILHRHEPETCQGLNTVAIICDDVTISNVYAHSRSNSDVGALKPISNENKTNEKTENVIELNVQSEVDFNRINLNDYFYYDSSNDNGSHIKHILAYKENISLAENMESSMSKSYYVGEYFTPIGISVDMNIADKKTINEIVFKLSINDLTEDKEGDSKTDFLNPFSEVCDGKYAVQILCNNDKIKSSQINLTIEPVVIDKIKIDDYEISYENKESFISEFSFESVPMSIVFSDGTEIDLNQDSEYVSNGILKCITKASSIGVGENIVYVQYSYGSTVIESYFKLTAIQKEITDIKVVTYPNKTKYTAGDVVDTTGMELCINYADGSQNIISGEDLKNIELIGETVSVGKNEVTVVYSDYTKTAKFTVTGTVKKGISIENGSVLNIIKVIVIINCIIILCSVTIVIIVVLKKRKKV